MLAGFVSALEHPALAATFSGAVNLSGFSYRINALDAINFSRSSQEITRPNTFSVDNDTIYDAQPSDE